VLYRFCLSLFSLYLRLDNSQRKEFLLAHGSEGQEAQVQVTSIFSAFGEDFVLLQLVAECRRVSRHMQKIANLLL
jgi:hypothetical protein